MNHDPTAPEATAPPGAATGERDRRTVHQRAAPATARALSPFRRWVEAVAAEAGAQERERSDIVLAVSEALSNVVLHAHPDETEPSSARVTILVNGSSLLIDVDDDGVGIQPRMDSPGGGMGLPLIASLSEQLEISRSPDGGARVRMRFGLAAAR